MEDSIAKLERDIIQYKTGQNTQGDSANYFCVDYTPGWYILDEDHWREHTIKCIPYKNSEKAIFMAQLCPNQFNVTGVNSVGRLLTYDQSIITWRQDGETSSKMADAGYAAGVPKGIMIFSNVDFYIEASYVDKSI